VTVPENGHEIKTLENSLWEAACKIGGEIDAPRYKDFILLITFIKRLSDLFQDEMDRLVDEFEGKDQAEELVKEVHSLVRFYIPEKARWEEISKQTTGLGEYLTSAARSIARENPRLQGVIDIVDFNDTTDGQRVISDESLKTLISVLDVHAYGLKDVEPDLLGGNRQTGSGSTTSYLLSLGPDFRMEVVGRRAIALDFFLVAFIIFFILLV
jgi:type I restriction enzyme M protein